MLSLQLNKCHDEVVVKLKLYLHLLLHWGNVLPCHGEKTGKPHALHFFPKGIEPDLIRIFLPKRNKAEKKATASVEAKPVGDVAEVRPAARPVVFKRENLRPPDVIAQKQRRTLELCAGSGGLSYALWKQGFDATGVDWLGNRHAPKTL